jgi:hypothetical protein
LAASTGLYADGRREFLDGVAETDVLAKAG